MKKIIGFLACLLVGCVGATAQVPDSTQIRINELEASLQYQTGSIELPSGNAILTVPQGFKYLSVEGVEEEEGGYEH